MASTIDKEKDIILGIDTSCDDTCAALVQKGRTVLANIISSQDIHKKWGGVVPELAARKHLEKISIVVTLALREAKLTWNDIAGIAVTSRYGLACALLVGVAMAKALSFAQHLPLVGVHHVEGHLYSNFLEHPEIAFPHISLTVSGGHTLLILVQEAFAYEVLGQTVDDAAGEAYDKVARYLGLGFPGGPAIDRLAKQNTEPPVAFPSPMLDSGDYKFSFSGIKTAVRYYVDRLAPDQLKTQLPAIADGFQRAVVRVLVSKAMQAAEAYGVKTITLSGGVAANSYLRAELIRTAGEKSMQVYYPSICYCTDNGAMIAGLGYHKFLQGCQSDLSLDIEPDAFLPITTH
jgi:N6-L-threonylcarbamoyladenine synthase